MLNNVIRLSRPVWQLIKSEWERSPRVLMMVLTRRFFFGYMLAQLICWLGLGFVLLAQLLFNPEQFAKNFASLALVHEAAAMSADVINDSLGPIGIFSGLGFIVILTWSWAIECLRYSVRHGWR